MRIFFYLNKRFQKIKQYYHQFGLRNTFIKVLQALFGMIYQQKVYEIVITKDLTEEMHFSFKDTIEIQRIEKSHLKTLKELCERCEGKNTGITSFVKINDFFENGYHGFVGFLGGNIIGYHWWVDNKITTARKHPDLDLFNIELEDADIYSFDTVILPQYRGHGNAIQFLYKAFVALNKLGYKREIGLLEPDNTPARWLYKLFGYKEGKRITGIRLLYFMLFMNKIIFLKTYRRCLYLPFGFRVVYPFKKSKFLNERRFFPDLPRKKWTQRW